MSEDLENEEGLHSLFYTFKIISIFSFLKKRKGK